MIHHNNEPVLLFIIANGTADEVKCAFTTRRITAQVVDDRPSWSRKFRGTMLEVQTLYGEYGGWLGSVRQESLHGYAEVDSAVHLSKHQKGSRLSAHMRMEQNANVRRMLDAIDELSQQGNVVLYLSTGAKAGSQIQYAKSDVTAEVLVSMPSDVPIIIR